MTGVRSCIDAQFWGQQVSSPSDLTGVVQLPPGDPAPTQLTRPSGLSREQQVLLAQSYGDLPCVPSFALEDGGLVLDRALASIGNQAAWCNVVGRLRAQRAWGQLRQGLRHMQVLGDVENYALAAKGVARLPWGAKALGKLHLGRADDLPRVMRAAAAFVRGDAMPEASRPRRAAGRLTLKAPAVLGHRWELSASFNERMRSHGSGAVTTPTSQVSLDLRPVKSGRAGITYRLGAIRLTPPSKASPSRGPAAPRSDDSPSRGSQSDGEIAPARVVERRRGLALGERGAARAALQGAVMAEGSVTLLGGQGGSGGSGGARASPGRVKRTSVPLGEGEMPILEGNDSSDPGELHLEQELKPHKAPFPMSVFVPRPHLSVGGACGLSVGTPLSGAPRHRAFPTLTEEAEGKAQGSAATAVMTRALQLVRSASNGVREKVSASSARVFASGMVSAQLGGFSRPFLDFTSLSVRADVGLPAPVLNPGGARSALSPDVDMCGGRLASAVTLDVCQQLWGPVRLRGNLRWVMEEQQGGQAQAEADTAVSRPRGVHSTPGSRLLRTVSSISGFGASRGSVEPVLADAVIGVDVCLPGTAGAGRLVAWYSHRRKEAMAEIRLM